MTRVVVTDNGQTSVVTAYTEGPQGQPGPAGPAGPQGPPGVGSVSNLGDLVDVNTTGKVNKSLLYYDTNSGKFKADAVWTTDTIVDGANF